MPSVVFVDVEALLTDHLRNVLPALGVAGPVGTRVPEPRPDLFTVITRTGGPAQNKVTDGPLIVVERWATDQGAAMDGAQIVRGVLHDLPGVSLDGTPVYRVEEASGPQFFPDPESGHPRARLTVEVWLRGTTP